MKKMNVMKKFLLMLFVAVVPMTLATSCSDDDDDDDDDRLLAQEVAGSYYGSYAVTELGGDKMGMALELKRTGNNEITISFGDISFGGMATASIPDVTGIELTGTESNVSIVESTKDIEVSLNIKGLGALDLPASLTITGSVSDGENLTLKAVIESAALALYPEIGGTTLTVNISAAKDADSLGDIAKGDYKGTYEVANLGGGDIEIYITKTANEQVTITLSEIEFYSIATASIPAITGIPLAGEAGNIIINDFETEIELGLGGVAENIIGSTAQATLTLKGTINDSEKLNLSIEVNCPSLALFQLSTMNISIEAEK